MVTQVEQLSQKILKKKSALIGILDREEEQFEWIKIRDIDVCGRILTAMNERAFLKDPSIKKIPVRLYLKFPAEELQIQITGICERYEGSKSNYHCDPGELLVRITMIYGEFSYRNDGEEYDIFSFFKDRILRLLRQSPSKKILVLR